MVTILPTLENSRKKSFDVAVDAIRTYIQEQHEMALLSGDLRGDAYNAAVGEASSGNGNTGKRNEDHSDHKRERC